MPSAVSRTQLKHLPVVQIKPGTTEILTPENLAQHTTRNSIVPGEPVLSNYAGNYAGKAKDVAEQVALGNNPVFFKNYFDKLFSIDLIKEDKKGNLKPGKDESLKSWFFRCLDSLQKPLYTALIESWKHAHRAYYEKNPEILMAKMQERLDQGKIKKIPEDSRGIKQELDNILFINGPSAEAEHAASNVLVDSMKNSFKLSNSYYLRSHLDFNAFQKFTEAYRKIYFALSELFINVELDLSQLIRANPLKFIQINKSKDNGGIYLSFKKEALETAMKSIEPKLHGENPACPHINIATGCPFRQVNKSKDEGKNENFLMKIYDYMQEQVEKHFGKDFDALVNQKV